MDLSLSSERVVCTSLVALSVLLPPPVKAETPPGEYDLRRTESSTAHVASNIAQGFDAWISGEGIRVRPKGAADWQLEMAVRSFGPSAAPAEVRPPTVAVKGRRASLHRAAFDEWYVNSEAGLEQGFTLVDRPDGSTDEPVVIELDLRTELVARARPGGTGLDFFKPGGHLAVLAYSKLEVVDADGEKIPARMQLSSSEDEDKTLRILIEDQDARYPLTVDPLLTTSSWASNETERTHEVAWGDWDGDGDLDLAVANHRDLDDPPDHPGPNRVYENEGGVLGTTAVWSSLDNNYTYSIAWGDWDGDGDLDLAAGNLWTPNIVYTNDGLGNSDSLVSVWESTETDETRGVAWGDWNNDGYLDLAVANHNGQPNRVYQNDGLGTSTSLTLAWTSPETNNTSHLAWADWNGDGHLDLAVANNLKNRVYQNDGEGNLDSLVAVWESDDISLTYQVAWGDMDGDGDFELAAANSTTANRVYNNTGGTLTTTAVWVSDDTDNTRSVAWGDWDGDGDLDLAVGSYGQVDRVYENTGTTIGTTSIWETATSTYTTMVAWGDWDNDGDLDLATAGWGAANLVYESDGHGLFPVWESTESENTRSVAWGDWDGDGDLDLAAASSGQPNLVYENTGDTISPTAVWASDDLDITTSIAWGDWDNDGDLDLAVGNYGQPNRVYENAGGNLQTAAIWASDDTDNTSYVAWGDWDSDGDLDLAAGNSGFNRVYENTGATLSPTAVWASAESEGTSCVAWGDWDGDGDLDLAAGNSSHNRLYENTGNTLSPTAVWASDDLDDTRSIAWGDWDNDGDLDLASGNRLQPNRIYENDAGTLASIWVSDDSDSEGSLAWGDWDGDGDLDLGVGVIDLFGAVRVYENVQGVLSVGWYWLWDEMDHILSLAWADLDGDGDLDLAAGTGGDISPSSNSLFENNSLLLHERLPDTPVSALLPYRPGTTDSAFFYSSSECLASPVSIPFLVIDEEADSARRIEAEYSLTGGGYWEVATPGAGGIGLTELLGSPEGTQYLFVWDSLADEVYMRDQVVFRITVPYQASLRLPLQIQLPALSATSPPFRVCDRAADLAITKDNGVEIISEGLDSIWAISITNNGPPYVSSARVVDNFPASVTNVWWTCTASTGASCGAPMGNNKID